jgi:hypothetical protein
MIAGTSADIRTGHLPNTRKRYREEASGSTKHREGSKLIKKRRGEIGIMTRLILIEESVTNPEYGQKILHHNV